MNITSGNRLKGIMLDGAEVKSIREGNANINDAFCYFDDTELLIRNFISPLISNLPGGLSMIHCVSENYCLKRMNSKKLKNRVEEKA